MRIWTRCDLPKLSSLVQNKQHLTANLIIIIEAFDIKSLITATPRHVAAATSRKYELSKPSSRCSPIGPPSVSRNHHPLEEFET
jgi:hypothetical protein